jgi:hypothetical protein
VETFRVFFDRSGEVARVSVHVDYRAVITANGHTIVERDKWMDVFYPDGTAACSHHSVCRTAIQEDTTIVDGGASS